jgi:hypothetical protein
MHELHQFQNFITLFWGPPLFPNETRYALRCNTCAFRVLLERRRHVVWAKRLLSLMEQLERGKLAVEAYLQELAEPQYAKGELFPGATFAARESPELLLARVPKNNNPSVGDRKEALRKSVEVAGEEPRGGSAKLDIFEAHQSPLRGNKPPFCPACGSIVDEEWKFCRQCGAAQS